MPRPHSRPIKSLSPGADLGISIFENSSANAILHLVLRPTGNLRVITEAGKKLTASDLVIFFDLASCL